MKLTVEKNALQNALKNITRAVSTRNTLPILANVLLETHGDRIALTATDLDTAITATVAASVVENGAIAVPASVLSDLAQKLPDAPVTLQKSGGTLIVSSGKSDYSILCLPAEDYPVIPTVENAPAVYLTQRTLKNALIRVLPCASKEETRSILMGVLFEARGDKLTLVATDTHRLSKKMIGSLGEPAQDTQRIIPSRALGFLLFNLSDTDDSILIRFGDSQVQFETADVTLVSRVLDGRFPNYEKVIPKEHELAATVNRVSLLQSLRRAMIVGKNNNEKLVLAFSSEKLLIDAQASDIGTASEEVACVCNGELTMGLNGRYLVEFLSQSSAETIEFSLNNALNPVVMRDGENDDWMALQMPMQI